MGESVSLSGSLKWLRISKVHLRVRLLLRQRPRHFHSKSALYLLQERKFVGSICRHKFAFQCSCPSRAFYFCFVLFALLKVAFAVLSSNSPIFFFSRSGTTCIRGVNCATVHETQTKQPNQATLVNWNAPSIGTPTTLHKKTFAKVWHIVVPLNK